MDFESLLPFLILIGVFLTAFVIEALVLFFFKVKPFWTSLGVSILINIVSLAFIFYVAGALLTKLGYPIGNFNGLRLPLQGVAFIWWVSTVLEGILISLWFKKAEKKQIYLASIVMNALSYAFVYLFVENSH